MVLAPSIRFAKFPDTHVSATVEVGRTCARGIHVNSDQRSLWVSGNLDAGPSSEFGRVEVTELWR